MIYYYYCKDGSSVRSAKTFDIILLFFFFFYKSQREYRIEFRRSGYCYNRRVANFNVIISFCIYIIILSKFAMKALTIVFLQLRSIFFIQFQIEFLEYISKIIVLLRQRYFCISITRIT